MKKKQKKYKAPAEIAKRPSMFAVSPAKIYSPLFIILGLTFIAYIPTLSAGFVNWDDPDYVSGNLMIKNITDLQRILSRPVQGNYHPLTMLSLSINYLISGLDAWSYHLFNLSLHLVNCYLVYRLTMLLSKNNLIIAATTALLFGIHPMHVESVAWVSERKDVLYGLFFLAALISYTRYIDTGSKKQYGLTMLFFVLSLLSKPAAVIFPLAIFSIDLLRNRKFNVKLLTEKLPLFFLALVMGAITYAAQKEKGATDGADIFDLGTRILMGFYGIMMYSIKFIFPVNLSPFSPFAPVNEELPLAYKIAPLFSVALIVLIFYSLKKNRVIAFGITFFLTNLLLVLQFLPVGSAVIADRYTYLPYLGLFYIVGWLIARYSGNKLSRIIYIGLPVSIILVILSYKQSSIWNNGASLWDHAIKVEPSARAYQNRGSIYRDEKKYQMALNCYNEALRINVAGHEAYMSRANVYFDLNKPDLAFADYKKALQIKPDYVAAMDNLAALFGMRLQNDSALVYLNKALGINPGYAPSYKNRALVNLELHRDEEALRDFKKFLEYYPNDADILNMIGICYRNLKRYNDALAIISKAISIKPDPHFFLSRAYCYQALNDIESARRDALNAKANGLSIDADLARSLGIQ